MAGNASDHAEREINMVGRLAGKTAVISGGVAVVGRVTSLLFARKDARVAIIGSQEEAGRDTVGRAASLPFRRLVRIRLTPPAIRKDGKQRPEVVRQVWRSPFVRASGS
jgi:NAD(P)-dependent dehydrogenase (short-subunit alcohol dehydrogenase family)